MDNEPTPTDQEQQEQPAPETQPDPTPPDTRQGRTDEEQDDRGSTAPGDD